MQQHAARRLDRGQSFAGAQRQASDARRAAVAASDADKCLQQPRKLDQARGDAA